MSSSISMRIHCAQSSLASYQWIVSSSINRNYSSIDHLPGPMFIYILWASNHLTVTCEESNEIQMNAREFELIVVIRGQLIKGCRKLKRWCEPVILDVHDAALLISESLGRHFTAESFDERLSGPIDAARKFNLIDALQDNIVRLHRVGRCERRPVDIDSCLTFSLCKLLLLFGIHHARACTQSGFCKLRPNMRSNWVT